MKRRNSRQTSLATIFRRASPAATVHVHSGDSSQLTNAAIAGGCDWLSAVCVTCGGPYRLLPYGRGTGSATIAGCSGVSSRCASSGT